MNANRLELYLSFGKKFLVTINLICFKTELLHTQILKNISSLKCFKDNKSLIIGQDLQCANFENDLRKNEHGKSRKHASNACGQFLIKLWTFLNEQQIFGSF